MDALILPVVGEGVAEVTISRWLKRAGEFVTAQEPICEVETDKISVEVAASASGTIQAILLPEGSRAKIGQALASLNDHTSALVAVSAPLALSKNAADEATPRARVSPVVARMAAEHKLDLGLVRGSGESGRVTKADVIAYLANGHPPAAGPAPELAATPSSTGGYDLLPVSAMRSRIAEHMLRSVTTSPHVTTIFEFDFEAIHRNRASQKAAFEREGIHLTLLAYLAHASAQVLPKHPLLNSQWSADGIKLMREVNLGIAVALPENGLVVPVIRHANELSLKGIARRLGELAQRARGNALEIADLNGGTFTITNHGAGGSLAGTPIINQPQAAILGFGNVERRVAVIGREGEEAIAIRRRAYMSLSFDHRLLDGAAADAFMRDLKRTVEQWAER